MNAGIRGLLFVCSCLAFSALRAAAQDFDPKTAPTAGQQVYQGHCSQCHDTGAVHAPSRESLRLVSPEIVLGALSPGGVMAGQGSGLTDEQKHAVARYVTGKDFGGQAATPAKAAYCTSPDDFDPGKGPRWNMWGVDDANSRFQPAADAGLPVADIPELKLKWAFVFPGAIQSNTQPTVGGGRLFISSWNDTVYSLDAKTGCIRWTYKTRELVRSAPLLARPSPDAPWRLYFGDWSGHVYALDAKTGKEVWTDTPADQANDPRATGSLKFYDGKLFVPLTTREEIEASASYECCKDPGRIIAYDAATGTKLWDTSTIAEPLHRTGVNWAGIPTWGPSGAGTWSAPTIDAKAGVVYITTGDNRSLPTTDTSDAIIAVDMKSGKVMWSRQFTKGDVFNGGIYGCSSRDHRDCPTPHGPDADFGSSAILVTKANGRRLLIAGQKSGVVHAVDPDRQGAVVWEKQVAKGGAYGGIEFGIAADRNAVYAPISDIDVRDHPEPGEKEKLGLLVGDRSKGGGLKALDVSTGRLIWAAPPIPCALDHPWCIPAQPAAPTVIPGAVFSGSLDGHIRAYSTKDGHILWDFDTARSYHDAGGGPDGQGGSIGGSGAVVVDGMLYTSSGDASPGTQTGNVLLAFGAK